MKKSLLALAVLGAFAGAASAQSSVTLYGIFDLGLVKQNRADALTERSLGGVGLATDQLSVNQATKSRLGFRGVEDLGGGLKGIFDLEHRFLGDVGATNPAGGNNFWDKSIVGLRSDSWGEITLGRDYGPTFYSQYLLDPWLNQGIAEVGGTTYAFAGYNLGGHEARYKNAIFYKAMLAGFTVLASVELSEVDGVDERYGIGANYTAGPLFLTGSYDQAQTSIPGRDQTDKLFIIGAAYDFGFIKPRLSYAQSQLETPFGGEAKPKSVTLAATIPVGTNLIKLGYTQIDWDTANPYLQAGIAGQLAGATSPAAVAALLGARDALLAGDDLKQRKFSIGYEHVLSKRTALYTDLTSGKTKGSDTVTGVDVGIRHMF